MTEDGLDMMGVVVRDGNALLKPEKRVPALRETILFQGMLVCHSLTRMEDELSGDPLDVKVKATRYVRDLRVSKISLSNE